MLAWQCEEEVWCQRHTDIVGPLQLDGKTLVSSIIRLNRLDNSNGRDVLQKDDGAGDGQVGRVADHSCED